MKSRTLSFGPFTLKRAPPFSLQEKACPTFGGGRGMKPDESLPPLTYYFYNTRLYPEFFLEVLLYIEAAFLYYFHVIGR